MKLRNQLMERKREAKKAFDLAGQIQKRVQQQAGAGGGEGRRPSARADEETYRVSWWWPAEQRQCMQRVSAACPCSTSSASPGQALNEGCALSTVCVHSAGCLLRNKVGRKCWKMSCLPEGTSAAVYIC